MIAMTIAHTNVRLLDLANNCFFSGGRNDVEEQENAICDFFRCQPESVSFDDDEDGNEWIFVRGEKVGRVSQRWVE